MYNSQSIDAVNRTAAATGDYQKIDLGIKSTNEETRNVVSSTFGQFIKNNLSAFWSGIGLDQNVTADIQKIAADPNLVIEGVNGKNYMPHSLVGRLNPYNEDGYPAGGCLSMILLG